jgi:uncharacterized protein (DUF924 family)
MTDLPTPPEGQPVLAFWREAGPSRWFRKDAAFDAEFRTRFLADHEAAARDELAHWARTAPGALALVLLLDQFPRNAFRGSARMFATDGQGRDVALAAIGRGFDKQTDEALRNFFYVPLMHSEKLADQEHAVALAQPLGGEALKFAILHRDIIARFGRFPHRNALLARTSTPEEQAFLDSGGFAG